MGKKNAVMALASVEIFLGSGAATEADVAEVQGKISEIARQIETGEGLVIAPETLVLNDRESRMFQQDARNLLTQIEPFALHGVSVRTMKPLNAEDIRHLQGAVIDFLASSQTMLKRIYA